MQISSRASRVSVFAFCMSDAFSWEVFLSLMKDASQTRDFSRELDAVFFISQKDFAIILSILNLNGGMIVKRTYDMKVAFYVSREQKDRFDYINARKDIDFSSKLRELMADYILENEHLLPDDLKFKPAESTE